MTDQSIKLIDNSMAEFRIFTGQSGEPRPTHNDAPASESQT